MSNSSPQLESIRQLWTSIKEGTSFRDQLSDILNTYISIESQGKLKEKTELIVLVFLHYLSGSFEAVLKYKNKYRVHYN